MKDIYIRTELLYMYDYMRITCRSEDVLTSTQVDPQFYTRRSKDVLSSTHVEVRTSSVLHVEVRTSSVLHR